MKKKIRYVTALDFKENTDFEEKTDQTIEIPPNALS